MEVLAIWRYPVKAMLGESLDAAHVGPGGCHGDRRFVVVDASTGERIANKRGPTDPRLRACRAELLDPGGGAGPPALRITLPGGATVDGGEIESALSELLERGVRLAAADAPARGAFAATGVFHDLAPIHLITTSTLAALRAAAPESDWDVRRFRPNLVLDDAGGGRHAEARAPDDRPPEEGRHGGRAEHAAGNGHRAFAEDALLGAALRAPSGLEMTVGLPTPRCVVPTRAHDELPADPAILRTIVARHRIDLGPVGRQGCTGSYAEIARAGPLRVGDRLDVTPGAAGGKDVIRASLSRLFP